jgi:hypothetical protein
VRRQSTGAHRRTPLALSCVTAVAAGLLILMTFAAPARAGTYPMNQCQAAGSRALSGSWGTFGSPPDGQLFNNCGSGGAFGFSTTYAMPYNTVGGLNVAVPNSRPNVTIAHVETDVTTPAEALDPDGQYSFFRLSGGGQIVFDHEMTGWAQHIGRDISPTRDFQVGIYCSYGTGPHNCWWQSQPAISVSRLALTLQENVPPTAQATGGTLLSGGTMSGTQTLSYSASDSDSGIHDVSVQLGSTTVASDAYAGQCAYDDWNACPMRRDRGDRSIDTSQVADGTYPLKFVVTDAAGNTATIDSGRVISVDNPGTNGPGAVAKPSSIRLVLGQTPGRAIRANYGRKVVITGQALTPDGKPLTSASLDVSAQIAQPLQDFSSLGQAQTDGNGAFAFLVPPGPNRTIRFAYTSPSVNGQQAKGQSDVTLQVRAGAQLKVSDRKVAGGRRVTFRGQLKGGPFPAGGVPIGFRGQVGKHTRKFADTQTDGKGRFHLVYKFPPGGPTHTYPIWVRIGADGADYPYLPGLSNRVRVTVLRG